MNTEIKFVADHDEATLFVMKVYDASVSEMWGYFTKHELLDLWWAPKPWKCETINHDFQVGGKWHYAMVGPEGEKSYANVDFTDINANRSISWKDYFSDENQVPNTDFPNASWLIGFTGMEEGFKMGLNQLEDLINQK